MKNVRNIGVKFIIACAMMLGVTNTLVANSCSTKLFSVSFVFYNLYKYQKV